MSETFCACGCGSVIIPLDDRGRPRQYLYRHFSRTPSSEQKRRASISAVLKGKRLSNSAKRKLREYHKNPHPNRAKKLSAAHQGKKLSKEHREKIRDAMLDKDLPRGKGWGQGGYREDIGHYVRSSYEANFARYLIHCDIPYEYESTRFKLSRADGSVCYYTPDFRVGDEYIEIKGYLSDSANEKLALFSEQYPDIRLAFVDKRQMRSLYNLFKEKCAFEECININYGG